MPLKSRDIPPELIPKLPPKLPPKLSPKFTSILVYSTPTYSQRMYPVRNILHPLHSTPITDVQTPSSNILPQTSTTSTTVNSTPSGTDFSSTGAIPKPRNLNHINHIQNQQYNYYP